MVTATADSPRLSSVDEARTKLPLERCDEPGDQIPNGGPDDCNSQIPTCKDTSPPAVESTATPPMLVEADDAQRFESIESRDEPGDQIPNGGPEDCNSQIPTCKDTSLPSVESTAIPPMLVEADDAQRFESIESCGQPGDQIPNEGAEDCNTHIPTCEDTLPAGRPSAASTAYDVQHSESSMDLCCVWEYQRWWLRIGWSAPGLAGDPPNFADADGEKVDQRPESWQVDKKTGDATDEFGWEYATKFSRFGTRRVHGRGVEGPKDRCRRRRLVPVGGAAPDDLSRAISDRKTRKNTALQGVRQQFTTLLSSRPVTRRLDLLSPVMWWRLRKQHLREYQAFLERLTPAILGTTQGTAENPISLPTALEIHYAFRFVMASYGTTLPVDKATQREDMLLLTGLSEDSLLQINEEGTLLRPAFGLFLDSTEKRCVLGIRGTKSTEDLLTNTITDPVFDEVLQGDVHKGILEAAQWILAEIEAALRAASAAHPDYTLLVTGHSLGAGVAAILTLLLDRQEPCAAGFCSVSGIGFATPCVAIRSIAAGEPAMRCFTTINCARDFIARTSVRNIYVLHHELNMVSIRTQLKDSLGKKLGGSLKRYSEKRKSQSAAVADAPQAGKECFPIGACIVLADPGESNARALLAMPCDITKLFVHEDMALDHRCDRYHIGLRCLDSAPEGANLFFGVMTHIDWGHVQGQLFATELEARKHYSTLSYFNSCMIVRPLGQIITYYGLDKVKGISRKDDMMTWYRSACKNEGCENHGPFTCLHYRGSGEVEGWAYDSVKEARAKYKSLSKLHASMLVDKGGHEILCYCMKQASKEAMMTWFRARETPSCVSSEDSHSACEVSEVFSPRSS